MILKRIKRRIKGYVLSFGWKARGVNLKDVIIITGLAPKLSCYGAITIGSRLNFRAEFIPSRIGAGPRGTLKIGDFCSFNSGVTIFAKISITIGDYCRLGEQVWIGDSDYHAIDEVSSTREMPVKLGRNVWVGNRSSILPGVSLGDHCVVGTGSIVTKSFPARSLLAGNPARLIRTLDASDDFIRS